MDTLPRQIEIALILQVHIVKKKFHRQRGSQKSTPIDMVGWQICERSSMHCPKPCNWARLTSNTLPLSVLRRRTQPKSMVHAPASVGTRGCHTARTSMLVQQLKGVNSYIHLRRVEPSMIETTGERITLCGCTSRISRGCEESGHKVF